MSQEQERARLTALGRLGLLVEGRDQGFQQLAELAAAVCGTPIAAVGFLGADRHVLLATVGADVGSVPREQALCEVPISTGTALVMSDVAADTAFCAHPAALGPLRVRAYAGAPVYDDDGIPVGTLCVIDTRPRPFTLLQVQTLTTLAQQVTTLLSLRRRDLQLQTLSEVLRASVDHSPVGVAVVPLRDGQPGAFADVNPAYCTLMGRTAEELAGMTFLELTHPDDVATDLPALAGIATGAPQVRLKRYLRPDGSVVWAEVVCTPLHSIDGTVDKALVHVTDVTDRRLREADLVDRARRDPLTGLPNRTLLLERLAATPTGVVAYLDLDDFKPVNDAYGHAVGDAVLTRLAERMRGSLRADDLLARVGGDEFVAVLQADPAVAQASVARLQAVVAEPVRIDGLSLRLSVSAGLAVVVDGDWRAALDAADAAMYDGKRGRAALVPVAGPVA